MYMYKTVSKWGRDLQYGEDSIFNNATATLVAEGKTDGVYIKNEQDGTVTRTWDSEETARAWAAFLNTMVPPPISVQVLPI